MPSKTSNHLRRLSWPTLINPNVLICKSRTMIEFANDEQSNKNQKEIRLIKLNNRHSSSKTTLVDNLFRSIRKRKLKHPINCFNRKNVKRLLSYRSNLSKSIRNNSSLTQSAINLNELESLNSFKSANQMQKRKLRRTRSTISEFELLSK